MKKRLAAKNVAAKEAFGCSYCRQPPCCAHPPKLNYCALSSIAHPIHTVPSSPERTGDYNTVMHIDYTMQTYHWCAYENGTHVYTCIKTNWYENDSYRLSTSEAARLATR